jgi:hypothetical protein
MSAKLYVLTYNFYRQFFGVCQRKGRDVLAKKVQSEWIDVVITKSFFRDFSR